MIVVIVLWLIFWYVSSVWTSLRMEIIPPHQRGRASAIGAWMFNFIIMLQTIASMTSFTASYCRSVANS